MKNVDVIVVGAGVGGICAALASARLCCRTLLIDKNPTVGGTAYYSPVALICKFRDSMGRPMNNGIHRELFPEAYRNSGDFFPEEKVPVYDEEVLAKRCRELMAQEPLLEVWNGTEVTGVRVENGRILSVQTMGEHAEEVQAKMFLDGTADGNLSVMAGADYEFGREGDNKTQTATVTFICSGIDRTKLKDPDLTTWGSHYSVRAELDEYYAKAKAQGKTSNRRNEVLCFPMPDGERLLFNSTAVVDVDATDPDSLARGKAEGDKQAAELMDIIRQHPAFARASMQKQGQWLGIRESRRIVGDYQLTAQDCLAARKFDDMVAACSYSIDVHDPDGIKSSRLVSIPFPGYYHIPYRCLIVKGLNNLLISSRCLSSTHEAHSSYRVMSGVTAVGEAAGTAAALCVRAGLDNVRDMPASKIRYILQSRGQFTEGEVTPTRLPYADKPI